MSSKCTTGRVLEAKIIGGAFRDDVVLIPRIALQPKDGEFPFQCRRRQFSDVFAHGELHVAASRVAHPDNIRFALQRYPRCTWTKNIVYKQVIE